VLVWPNDMILNGLRLAVWPGRNATLKNQAFAARDSAKKTASADSVATVKVEVLRASLSDAPGMTVFTKLESQLLRGWSNSCEIRVFRDVVLSFAVGLERLRKFRCHFYIRLVT
jgi:hypothetical protein